MFNFSNLTSLFKKKPAETVSAEAIAPEPVTEKRIQIDDIAIHAMPERFRHQTAKVANAKSAGLLIVVGGAVILILASAALYYYLFGKPAITVKTEPIIPVETPVQNEPTEPEVDQNLNPAASSTDQVVLPVDNPIATSTATTTPETIEPDLTIGLMPGLDSDSDGLTDAEEIILGASTSTPDTDGDGYLDLSETENLYDPAGPGKLSANPGIALYDNITFNYTVLYSAAWQSSVNGGDDSVMFKSADNQFFQIIVQDNSSGQALDQWYLDQLDVMEINDSDRLNGANWQGIKSLDGLTLYLMDSQKKNIFTLAYNPGENNVMEYINLFNLMIKSFSLKE